MENTEIIKLNLIGLACANCANKIEQNVNKMKEVEEATVNFSICQLSLKINEGEKRSEVIEEIKLMVNQLEPDVKVEEQSLEPNHKKKEKESFNFKEFLQDNKFLLIGTVIFIFASLSDLGPWLYLIAYVLIGGEVLLTAGKNILRGEIFDENFLMTIATLGALFLREYPEAIAVMLFYEIGEMFQHYAVNRSRQSISSLLDIRVDSAHRATAQGIQTVAIEEIQLDEEIIVKPGERIPLDGVILEGESELDTSALTGETALRFATVGDEILAGAINTNALLKIRVTSTASTSTVARILELVENASNKKAPTERFITKFSRIYTPVVVIIAVLVATVPTLLFGQDFSVWLYKALVFLVVSCPCALVVSIPLGFFAGIGGASKEGVLVKGANYLDMLKDVETVVFDKTGTLTKGNFVVSEMKAIGIDEDEFIKLAAYAESQSNHPIAKSIVKAYGKEIIQDEMTDYEEVAGKGVKVSINNKKIIIGNDKLMVENKTSILEASNVGTTVHMLINGEYKGYLVIADEVKETSKQAIANLRKIGVKKIVMLTGDSKKIADKVGVDLEIDEVHSELLPHQKVERVETLLTQMSAKGKLAFVGDGMNDAPVLARADIGVAMGGIGSDAAIEAADIVLMQDDPMALVSGIRKGQQTSRILRQNIIFALGTKFIIMILSLMGIATMWLAVFADVGVTFLAILNSIRALHTKNSNEK